MNVVHLPGLPEVPRTPAQLEQYLAPTYFLDWQAPAVQRFVSDAIGDAPDARSRAVRLFYAVRDRIRYDPYRISYEPAAYRASQVIEDGYGWCVSKAGLLAACARAVGIASAIGLADVVNHLNTEKLRARMGGVDVFYDHGYAVLLIEGRWVKAVPAFNIELCERFRRAPDRLRRASDALYQEHDAHGRLHAVLPTTAPVGPPAAAGARGHAAALSGAHVPAGADSDSVAPGDRFENETRSPDNASSGRASRGPEARVRRRRLPRNCASHCAWRIRASWCCCFTGS